MSLLCTRFLCQLCLIDNLKSKAVLYTALIDSNQALVFGFCAYFFPDEILDVYAGVLLSAHKGEKEVAISDIHEAIRKKLGDAEAEKLAAAVSIHMDQSLDDSSVFFPIR